MNLIMLRTASDDFVALKTASAMAECGLRIVSITPWDGQLLVFAQSLYGQINYEHVDSVIDKRLSRYDSPDPITDSE